MTREEEAFNLRGEAVALYGFVGTYSTMLPLPLKHALVRTGNAQMALAHALTLPPTRFRSG